MWKDHCIFFLFFIIILIRKRVSLPPVVGSCSPCPPWVSAVVTLAGGWTYPSSASIRAGEGGDPQPRISRVCCRSWSVSAEPSASSFQSGNRSWPEWQPAQTRDCRSWRTLRTKWRCVLYNHHVIRRGGILHRSKLTVFLLMYYHNNFKFFSRTHMQYCVAGDK